jgi:hypothetical protein
VSWPGQQEGEEARVNHPVTSNAQVQTTVLETGPTAMAILNLPLPPQIEVRALLHHLLEHGDIVGEDATGRTIVQLALDTGLWRS